MRIDFTRPEPPTDDKRWKIVRATMRRHGDEPHALIETLHTVQNSFGFLDDDALQFVAASLRVPYSRAYGVATFYHHFTLRPPGKHTCVVCTGTACHIKGSGELLGHIGQQFNVAPGTTGSDGQLSVLTARCLGACGLAPVAVFDGDVVGKLDVAGLDGRLRGWVGHDA